ncbi:MAG: hypothetical protein ACTMHL_05720, partial [Janibacter sp.]
VIPKPRRSVTAAIAGTTIGATVRAGIADVGTGRHATDGLLGRVGGLVRRLRHDASPLLSVDGTCSAIAAPCLPKYRAGRKATHSTEP